MYVCVYRVLVKRQEVNAVIFKVSIHFGCLLVHFKLTIGRSFVEKRFEMTTYLFQYEA